VNALAALVSFGVSGIYLAFMLVVIGALLARLRGWKPEGAFKLGRFAYPVIIGAIVYGVLMLTNIVAPTGISSPKSVLFNNDWITLLVIVLIVVIGALFYFVAHPQRRVAAGADTQLAAEAAKPSP
jgi:amino acid transporter